MPYVNVDFNLASALLYTSRVRGVCVWGGGGLNYIGLLT